MFLQRDFDLTVDKLEFPKPTMEKLSMYQIIKSLLQKLVNKYDLGNRSYLRLFGILITTTSLYIVTYGTWNRGGDYQDRVIWLLVSVSFCLGGQFLIFSKTSVFARVIGGFCILATVLVISINLHFADERISLDNSKISEASLGIERQITELRKSLASISARPISSIVQELVGTTDLRVKKALEIELNESKRAITIQEQLMVLVQTASSSKPKEFSLPVGLIASITGFSEVNTQLAVEIYYSLLLELLGAHVWYLFNLQEKSHALVFSSDFATTDTLEDGDLSRVKAAIAAGKLKLSVENVRRYLSCAQARSQEICRILRNK